MPVPDAYHRLVASADIAVGVLVNANGTDAEYIPLAPRRFPESTTCALEIQWAPRHLHFAGVMTWTEALGIQTQLEPLPDTVAARLNRGFEAYLTAFSNDSKVN
jgi:hypothetical protein